MRAYREASEGDLPAICALGEVVNLLHHEAWPHIFAGPGDPMRMASHWHQSIAAERAVTIVCVNEGNLIGFVTVQVTQDSNPLLKAAAYARVGSLCVGKEHQGQGVGKTLMAMAERWALDRGATDIRLNVWEFNQRALQLYRELGYEVRAHSLGKRLQSPDA